MIDSTRACVFDSYEVQIVCGDRQWTQPVAFGRHGAGPGELGRSGSLAGGPSGSLVFIDRRNHRVSQFTSELEFARSTPLPTLLLPGSDVSPDGVITFFSWPAPGRLAQQRLARLDVTTGVVQEEVVVEFSAERATGDAAVFSGGVVAPDGRLLMRITTGVENYVAWYESDGSLLGILNLPALAKLRPQPRARERTEEVFRDLMPRERLDRLITSIEEMPPRFLPRGEGHRMLQVDDKGRAWILSNRASNRGSFFELFDGTAYIGSLEVAGHVLAFHIRERVLAALVEPLNSDSLGLYPRRIDWYRIVARQDSQPADPKRDL